MLQNSIYMRESRGEIDSS